MPGSLISIDGSRSSEWAALGACALLAATVLWLVVRLIWLLVPHGDTVLDAAAARTGAPVASAGTSAISKWHLFGNTPVRPGTGPGATTLSLILRGTLADRDPKAGIAVLSDSYRGERAYRAGETLSQGVRLDRVYPDHVVLVHDGAEETLKLTREENLAPSDIVRAPPGASGAASRRASPGAAAALANAQAARASPAARETIERLRQNPDELARRVQIAPVFDGGKLAGVRVSSTTDAALINQLGLRPGDLVTAVNGSPVDSLARGQQIIESLRSASSLRVTVLRNGKPTDVVVNLK